MCAQDGYLSAMPRVWKAAVRGPDPDVQLPLSSKWCRGFLRLAKRTSGRYFPQPGDPLAGINLRGGAAGGCSCCLRSRSHADPDRKEKGSEAIIHPQGYRILRMLFGLELAGGGTRTRRRRERCVPSSSA